MVYKQPRIRLGEWDEQIPLEFWDINGSSSLGQTIRPSDSQQKTETCRIVDITVPTDHRVKLKESEKRDKYIDLARDSWITKGQPNSSQNTRPSANY